MDEKTTIYGDFINFLSPESKWMTGIFPMPDGSVWRMQEPNAVVVVQDGRLRVKIGPLTRYHDQFQILDNAKNHIWSKERITPPEHGQISFEWDMRASVLGAAPGDVYDGFVSFHLLNFGLGTAFNFFISNEKAATVYARLPFPGVPPPPDDGQRYFCIFKEFALPRPEDWHHYQIVHNTVENTLRWLVDGQEVNFQTGAPRVNSYLMALGLMTEKDIRGGKSISNHGQAITGEWSPITITVKDGELGKDPGS
ncbi:MAG: hypothetical protein EXR62_09645 [Chloroflexi bacterium]|nr:hypothetical protein [Chloroflexota bacterium]